MATGNDRYAYLNQFSTDQLKALLRADMWTEDNSDTDAMLYILQILEQRETETSPQSKIDLDQAWAEFQTVYHVPEGKGQALYPESDDKDPAQTPQQSRKTVPFHRVFRKIAVVAAVVGICILSMVAAQAAGLDIFGALAKWTDETLQFVVSDRADRQAPNQNGNNTQNEEYYQQISEQLEKCGIPVELAPQYIPTGFTLKKLECSSIGKTKTVSCAFLRADSDEHLAISYSNFDDLNTLQSLEIEKDESSVKQYVINDMAYYRFNNLEEHVATWSDGNSLMVMVTGTISENCMDLILQGIG